MTSKPDRRGFLSTISAAAMAAALPASRVRADLLCQPVPAMPNAALSTDIIVGFCSETLEDHEQTKSIMREVEYEGAYMFNYSPRPNTRAFDTLADDVPDQEKTR